MTAPILLALFLNVLWVPVGVQIRRRWRLTLGGIPPVRLASVSDPRRARGTFVTASAAFGAVVGYVAALITRWISINPFAPTQLPKQTVGLIVGSAVLSAPSVR